MNPEQFQHLLSQVTNFSPNPYHPLVWISGDPSIGKNVFIGGMSGINAKDSDISIGDYCDIASFVSINVADSHKRCLGLSQDIIRRPIHIEHHVFIGTHSVIKGGAHIGHHSVVAAGTIVEGVIIPPYSLIFGNPMQVRENYYRQQLVATCDEI